MKEVMGKRLKEKMFQVVLVEPEIPQNTGNIARTCAATGCVLHLVRPLGFELSDKYLRRAGLDYWGQVDVRIHDGLEEFLSGVEEGTRLHFFTTKAKKCYTEAKYGAGDALIFGRETKGLEEELLLVHAEECVRIPMAEDRRSLNLSNAVAIGVYEGLRQNDFAGMKTAGELHRLKW